MRILISAYACEPDRGSEPGVGWHWAKEMAAENDVWVLTRANNREAIERALAEEPEPRMHFLYVDLPRWASFWKRGSRGVHAYYYFWQFAAARRAEEAHSAHKFELVHHLTFANAFTPALVGRVPAPFVLGPVGGGVRVPWRYAPEWGLRGTSYEVLRAIRRLVGRYLDPFVRQSWRQATLILVQNEETLNALPKRHRAKTRVCPNAGYDPKDIVARRPAPIGQLTLVYAGRLIHLKGISLALKAVARSEVVDLRFVIAGEGPARGALEQLAGRLGLDDIVDFTGWIDRPRLFELFASSDVLLFPSMHEECGFVPLEAMAHGVVPVVVAKGGPRMLADGVGFALDADRLTRADLIDGLAQSLSVLADPTLRANASAAARAKAAEYEWSRKPSSVTGPRADQNLVSARDPE